MDFRCRRCGNCCRWSGCVKLEEGEADRLAVFLGMQPGEFLTEYTRLMPDRSGLSLTERPDGSCIFLDERELPECRVEGAKPRQCRRFPEHWNFPGWEKECKGSTY